MKTHFEIHFYRDGIHPLGSTWTHYHNLKTLGGVLRRMKTGYYLPSPHYRIYQVSGNNYALKFPYMHGIA